MSDSVAAARYAQALFNLADQQKDLDAASAALSEVGVALRRHPEISHLVLNSTISQTEKEDFIDKVFPSSRSLLVIQFLKVLIKKRRFRQFFDLHDSFNRLYDQKRGIHDVTVITAVPISKANEEKLTAVLKKKLNAQIRLNPSVDPKILGGFILRFDGKEINGSFKNRIQKLSQLMFI